MIKYTHKENKDMLQKINAQAHGIGLLQPNENLVYEKGNTSYGHATRITVVRKDEDGTRHPQPRPIWVPEFGYKDGPSVVGAAIVAAGNVIYHIFHEQVIREHDERQARLGLSE